jgi:two-component system chemotaxis response regulator CheY
MTTPVADIVLAENDQDLRDSMVSTLKNAGYKVEAFANGREALEWLEVAAHPPQLLLIDLMMPVLDGWHFLDELQKSPRDAAIPVVVLSASGSFAGRSESIPFLRKPIAVKPLLAVVARYCAPAAPVTPATPATPA